MFDSFDWPRVQGLVYAAMDCLRAIQKKAEEEARLAKIRADKESDTGGDIVWPKQAVGPSRPCKIVGSAPAPLYPPTDNE